jgi:hypothetical protein
LSVVEFLGFSEVQKVQVIGVNQSLVGGAVEIVPPLLKGSDDPQEFSVVDLVSSFRWVESFGKETDRVAPSGGVHLRKYRSGGVF